MEYTVPNVIFFDADDYKLQILPVYKHNFPIPSWWRFSCKIFGMPLICEKRYKTESGARKAGEKWLKENIHDEMP